MSFFFGSTGGGTLSKLFQKQKQNYSHLLRQLRHRQRPVLLRAARRQRREPDHEEVQARERDQVDGWGGRGWGAGEEGGTRKRDEKKKCHFSPRSFSFPDRHPTTTAPSFLELGGLYVHFDLHHLLPAAAARTKKYRCLFFFNSALPFILRFFSGVPPTNEQARGNLGVLLGS